MSTARSVSRDFGDPPEDHLTTEERAVFEDLIGRIVTVRRQVNQDLVHEQSASLSEYTALRRPRGVTAGCG